MKQKLLVPLGLMMRLQLLLLPIVQTMMKQKLQVPPDAMMLLLLLWLLPIVRIMKMRLISKIMKIQERQRTSITTRSLTSLLQFLFWYFRF